MNKKDKAVLLKVEKFIEKFKGGASARASARASLTRSASSPTASLTRKASSASPRASARASLTRSASPRASPTRKAPRTWRTYAVATATFAGLLFIVIHGGHSAAATYVIKNAPDLFKYLGYAGNFVGEAGNFVIVGPIKFVLEYFITCITSIPGLIYAAFASLYTCAQNMFVSSAMISGFGYSLNTGLPKLVKMVGLIDEVPDNAIGPVVSPAKMVIIKDHIKTMQAELDKLKTQMENAVYDPDSNLSKEEQLDKLVKTTTQNALHGTLKIKSQ